MAIADPTSAPTVQAQLGAYRRRIRRARRLLYLGRAALAAAIGWLGAALLFTLGNAPAWLLPAALVGTVLLVAGALAIEAWRRPSLAQTAALLDAHLDNRQRLVTAVELLAAQAPPPLAQAQLTSTAQLLAQADPRIVYPIRRRGPLFGLSLGLLCLALGIFLLKGVPANFAPLQPGQLPADKAMAAALLSPTPESGLPGAPTPPPDPNALGAATPAAGAAAIGTPGAAPDPADVARQQAASQAAQNGLDRLAQALDQQSITQQAADDLRQGQYDQAAQELANLGEQSDQLSHAARQSLANALEAAAGDPATPPNLSHAERIAADALRDGDYPAVAQALKDLGDAIKQTGQNVLSQQQLAQNYPTPGTGQGSQDGQNAQGGQDAQGQSGQQGQQGQGDQAGQDASAGQGGQDAGQAGQSGQPGQGQGQDANGAPTTGDSGGGDATGSGAGGSGQGTRVSGPDDSTPLNVPGNPFELDNRPAPGQDTGQQPDTPPGVDVNANGTTAGASAPVPGAAVTQPDEDNRLPAARWQQVQRYFTPDNGQ